MKEDMGGDRTKGVEGWQRYPHNRKRAKYGKKEHRCRDERSPVHPCCDRS